MASSIRLKLFSILLFYNVLFSLSVSVTGTDSIFMHYNCTNKATFGPKSTYRSNLNKLLSTLTSKACNSTTSHGFYHATVSGANKRHIVYGLFMCNGYIEKLKCGKCVRKSIETLKSKCVNSNNKKAIIWTDDCMVRYSNQFFFNTTEEWPSLCEKNSEDYEGQLDSFNKVLSSLIEDLLTKASEVPIGSNKFAVKKVTISEDKQLFGFAQCIPNLSMDNCKKCLRHATDFLQICARGKIGGRILYPSCILRYDPNLFFRPPIGGEEITTEINSLHFDLNTIQEATNKFSDDNKIGEGGFGAVYKGVCRGGLEIAVKRLKRNSRQGAIEFKKEVLLISKLQHRNLVRLFGVIILEIISGKRNVDCTGVDSDDLLSYAWKKWKESKHFELLDPTLKHSFSETEITRCVQIGLLCVQGNPDQRPIMSTISLYFNCDQDDLPLPQEPAFLMRGKAEIKDN
ncbi:hypothetical protein Fmac_026610 [Flemingia macrophylla]|uniref:Cysteine-rich receptor-like protein kinase n=1 Tax=Flemingia macrophylla TaxID=520843 RepID=A0ABD1LFI9_9FABA